jgi:hypothetical protein
MSEEDSHEIFNKKLLAKGMIHHHFANFAESRINKKEWLNTIRWVLIASVVLMLILQIVMTWNGPFNLVYSLLGNIDNYAMISTILAVIFSIIASEVKDTEKPTEREI